MCVCNVFSQTKNIHLRLLKLEKENNQSYLFLVLLLQGWNETKSNFENDFTCYTLTMAGLCVLPQPNASFKTGEAKVKFIVEY
jgi:hypothetical protein